MDKNDINNTESTLPGTLRGAIEAVVLIVDTPITTCDLARAVDSDEETVRNILVQWSDELNSAQCCLDLRAVREGWSV